MKKETNWDELHEVKGNTGFNAKGIADLEKTTGQFKHESFDNYLREMRKKHTSTGGWKKDTERMLLNWP